MTTPDDSFEIREQLAHRLIDALGFEARWQRRMDATALQTDSGKRLHERLERAGVTAAALKPAMARHYAAHLTTEVLRSAIAFFESPMGRQFVGVWQQDAVEVRKIIARGFESSRDDVHRILEDLTATEDRPPWE